MKRTKEDKIEGTSELAYPDIDQGRCTTRAAPTGMRVVTREAKNHGCVLFYWKPAVLRTVARAWRRRLYAIEGIMKGAAAGKYSYAD